MKNKILSLLLCIFIITMLLPISVFAYSDPNNGDWSSKAVTLSKPLKQI